ncbi:Nucleoporin NUP188 [Frankliniella fusca]|uniref:Nucleoporin NUP188 n=1 Tax=Frankliniella fusca TaxID=407009 RepID=A0AAE1LDM4_9NEOP|nr:Nucleoporin NUP188 [Frankliniella fusca]
MNAALSPDNSCGFVSLDGALSVCAVCHGEPTIDQQTYVMGAVMLVAAVARQRSRDFTSSIGAIAVAGASRWSSFENRKMYERFKNLTENQLLALLKSLNVSSRILETFENN